MTATYRPTRTVAIADIRSNRPSAQRYSTANIAALNEAHSAQAPAEARPPLSMHRRKCRRVRSVQTFRMTEAAGALADSPGPARGLTSAAIIGGYPAIRNDVEDDIVRVGHIRDALHATERIEPKSVANFPGNHMVCAR